MKKKTISIITSIMLMISFAFPAELVYAEENVVSQDAESAVAQEPEAEVVEAAEATDAVAESPDEPSSYVPNEVIVVFDNNKALRQAEATVESAVEATEDTEVAEDITVETISKTDKAVLVQSDENIDEMALCEELEELNNVAFAQPNYYYEMDADEDLDPATADGMWNLDYIDAQEAWDYIDQLETGDSWNSEQHPRVKVAVLDTGINLNHEDFADTEDGGNIDKKFCEAKGKGSGHGTRTAGLIAATNNGKGVTGVAAGNDNSIVELIEINVFTTVTGKSQNLATTAEIIDGINSAKSSGARIIQMCLGHTPYTEEETEDKHNDEALEKAINSAVSEGIVVTASAGNKNDDRIWYPSDFKACISVINTIKYSKTTDMCKAPLSSYGDAKDISAPGKCVNLVGNGTNDYVNSSGTSYAAPLVAGVAALMLYVNPELKVDQVKQILYDTATDLYTTGYDIYTGYGNVNAYDAVYMAATGKKKIYDKEVVNKKYLKSAATCTSPAVYYKSSEDGESSAGKAKEASFTYGGLGSHSPTTVGAYSAGCTSCGYTGDTVCTVCGARLATGSYTAAHGHYVVKTRKVNSTCCSLGYKAHYECAYCHQCYKDKKGKKKTSLSKYKIKKKKHSYTKKIAAPQYLKKAATKKSAAIYRKSCKWCGKAGKSTFKYGKKLPK